MSRYERSPQAIEDLVEIASYIRQDSELGGDRFLEAARATFEQIAGMPRIGRVYQAGPAALKGLRRWPIRGFENFLIFYLERGGKVDVLRVLHGARDIEAILGE